MWWKYERFSSVKALHSVAYGCPFNRWFDQITYRSSFQPRQFYDFQYHKEKQNSFINSNLILCYNKKTNKNTQNNKKHFTCITDHLQIYSLDALARAGPSTARHCSNMGKPISILSYLKCILFCKHKYLIFSFFVCFFFTMFKYKQTFTIKLHISCVNIFKQFNLPLFPFNQIFVLF